MRIAPACLLVVAGAVGAFPAANQATARQALEGALCTRFVSKAREGKTLTADEWKYLQDWCVIKDPYVWDISRPPSLR